ncbi:hypothetical protein [Methylotuvimicrobium alcaliphilum]|uniref:hypothetical protein n=1 Tax=Methylotuvimicrobium alcaliphilum TaxID=271065 RepID=UPI0013922D17|nr:hypothetical protein [Methylotuvimicrobium alcaliphilum]
MTDTTVQAIPHAAANAEDTQDARRAAEVSSAFAAEPSRITSEVLENGRPPDVYRRIQRAHLDPG